MLHDRAAESGVRFEYGKRLVGAIEGPDSVTAKFDDGCTATADVLIGADGVRSTVRTLIDPEAPAAGYTGLLSFQGYIDAAPDLDPEPGVMTFAFGKRAYYLFWKMADGRVTWGANLPSKQYMSLSRRPGDPVRAVAADAARNVLGRPSGRAAGEPHHRGKPRHHRSDPHHAAGPALAPRPHGAGR